MKERGLLLNTDLRPKARCGDKTNTRRLPKFQPLTPNSVLCTLTDSTSREDSKFKGYNYFCEIKNGREVKGTRTGYFKPQYQVGDHLYLQEPYQIEACNIFRVCCVNYSDDNKGKKRTLTSRELKLWNNRKKPYMKTSSRFMYKSLARTWFEVTEVRAERLQDISLAGIESEGVTFDLIRRLLKDAKIKQGHWIHGGEYDQSEDYCYDCAKKKVDKLNSAAGNKEYGVDGGWESHDSDYMARCENCDVLLNFYPTDHFIETELDGWEESGQISLLCNEDRYLFDVMCCAASDQDEAIQHRILKLCWRYLWDSCSPDGFKWKDNPFVFAYTFKKIEKVKL